MKATFLRLLSALVLLVGLAGPEQRVIASPSLFDAIRRADIEAVRTMVAAAADVKAGDTTRVRRR